MIVRDEARSIERCLVSALPWVDETIVLDTGSLDATPEIARRLGARVESFRWSDDFSAARNAALALTDAPWRLVLDGDEWITHGGESLAALRDQAAGFVGQISVASQFDDADGTLGHAPSWLPRVLPRAVRYAGRIHEQPESSLPRRRLPLVVAHDGYRDAQKAKKQGRNEALLTRRARGGARRCLSPLPARQGPRGARPVRERCGALPARARGRALERRLAPRPRRAHALHAQEARAPRRRDRPGRGRDAALASLARLLLHPRRRAARLRGEHAGARRRAAADDRVELAARARHRRAARAAGHGAGPRQLPRRAQPRRPARAASATTPRRGAGASAPRACATRRAEADRPAPRPARTGPETGRISAHRRSGRRLPSSPRFHSPPAARAPIGCLDMALALPTPAPPGSVARARARPSALAGGTGARRARAVAARRPGRSSRRRRSTATLPTYCTRPTP